MFGLLSLIELDGMVLLSLCVSAFLECSSVKASGTDIFSSALALPPREVDVLKACEFVRVFYFMRR